MEIKVGSYWRHKKYSTTITQVIAGKYHPTYINYDYKTYPEKSDIDVAFPTYCTTPQCFIKYWIPLGRLEVVVLLGEAPDEI